MIIDWTSALEATALAKALRGSVWAYPLVNAGHILGIAILIGAVVPLDLRLLGLWPSVPLAPVWWVLTRTAVFGLGLALVCGALLFITRATQYVDSSIFLVKMVCVGAGIVNALVLRAVVPENRLPARPSPSDLSPGVRIAAGVSLTAWLSALVLGRLIGYF